MRLWGEDPPGTARSVLQVYVANPAKDPRACQAARAQRAPYWRRAPGYLLDLDEHGFDLARFERLAAEGLDALASGDPQAAAATLRQALGALARTDPRRRGRPARLPGLGAAASPE
jgi:hypothetical protein